MSVPSILAPFILALGICQIAQAENGRGIVRVTEARAIDVVDHDEGLLIAALKLIGTCERHILVGGEKGKTKLFALTAYRDLITTRAFTVFRYIEPIQDNPFSVGVDEDGLLLQAIAEITIIDVNAGSKRIYAYTDRGDLLEYHSPDKQLLESLLAQITINAEQDGAEQAPTAPESK